MEIHFNSQSNQKLSPEDLRQIKQIASFAIPLVIAIFVYIIIGMCFVFSNAVVIGILFSFFGLAGILGLAYYLVLRSVPQPQGSPLPKQELVNKLLDFGNKEVPFTIKQEGDLFNISWNLVDAKWYWFFSVSGLQQNYVLTLNLVESSHTVRAIETQSRREQTVGLPQTNFSFSFFRGWTLFNFQKEVGYGIKSLDPVQAGKLYDLHLNTGEFRSVILDAIAASGWKIRPCVLSLKLGI